MLYELRSYEAAPGLMAVLDKHLQVACRLFPKHGFGVLGPWTDDVGTGGRMTYMWAVKDEASRHASLATFASDPEWKSYADEERKAHGAVVVNVENTLMRPTAYWPEAKMAGRVQELRVYDTMPGRLPDLNRRFSEHTIAIFKRHNIGIVGFWTEMTGSSSRLVYMLEYDGLGAREASWTSFAGDAEWHKVRAETEKNGPLVKRISNRILRPAKFALRG